MVRRRRPAVVVETGVAAGFSSAAILAALEVNGDGRLLSSDFPYFRLPNPESFIGIVVEERLKKNWTLFIEGDENNIPKIIEEVNSIDVFHYDSDKSYSGRQAALEMIEEKLSADAVLIMDDIQDNSFFHDLIQKRKPDHWWIFAFEGKFVGIVGAV